MAKDTEKKKVIRLTTPLFLLSFPCLFVARKPDEGDGAAKFSATGIWRPADFSPKDKELWAALIEQLNIVSLRAFGKPFNKLPDTIKRGLRNGTAKEGLVGYGEGTRFANMSSPSQPGVILNKKDKHGQYIVVSPENKNTEEMYPGAICRATVNVWSFGGDGDKPSKGKGVMIGLYNIKKVKDGPRLDNRVAAEDDFDDDLDAEFLDDVGDDDNDAGDMDGDDDDF